MWVGQQPLLCDRHVTCLELFDNETVESLIWKFLKAGCFMLYGGNRYVDSNRRMRKRARTVV